MYILCNIHFWRIKFQVLPSWFSRIFFKRTLLAVRYIECMESVFVRQGVWIFFQLNWIVNCSIKLSCYTKTPQINSVTSISCLFAEIFGAIFFFNKSSVNVHVLHVYLLFGWLLELSVNKQFCSTLLFLFLKFSSLFYQIKICRSSSLSSSLFFNFVCHTESLNRQKIR